MLDFKSHIKTLKGKYLVTERHLLQIQGIFLQYLNLISQYVDNNFLYKWADKSTKSYDMFDFRIYIKKL